MRLYKRSSDTVLKDASDKLVAVKDDKEYVEGVLAKPKFVEEVQTPSKCHSSKGCLKSPDGKCSNLCSILKKIGEKQDEHRVRKLKLSLKYRRKSSD